MNVSFLRPGVRALGAGLLVIATAVPVAVARDGPAAAAVASNQGVTSAVALISRPGDADLVVYRGQDNGVYQRTLTGTTWSAETSLGGRILGAPAIAAAGSGTLALAGRGTDGALWLRLYSAGAWGAWQSLGGYITATPAVVGAPDGRLDVFARGGNGALYTRTRLPGAAWSAWVSRGGQLNSGPAAVALASGKIDVYALGTNYAVFRIGLAGGVWSAWSTLGGRSYTAPAAAALSSGAVRVFIRNTSNALSVNDNTAGTWSGWTVLGGVLIDAPGAAGTASGNGVDVIVRGTDNALWTTRFRSGVWSAFSPGWAPAQPLPPAAGRLGTDWTRIPNSGKVVALTFDAGANANGLPSILTTLRNKKVPAATFFLTGAWTRNFPAEANQVAIGGFLVGNHSDTHPHFPQLTDAQVTAQVRDAERAVLLANGAQARPTFRFPYGDVNARVLGDVNTLGYVAVRWTVDSLGWQGTSGGMTTQKVIDRVLAAAQSGAIVLMHVGSNPDDGTTLDAAALPAIIDGLRARGYGFVTLAALTG